MTNNKRIVKNTMFLYFRQLLNMFVSLFTVRIVLDALGTEDYGIYNVVGGVVVMFSFLSGIMATASQRYFAYELGTNNKLQLQKTFSQMLTMYFLVAIIILILAETLGIWFLKTQMTIPDNRMNAAKWVFHFSVLSFMMTVITIPYNASIIAHEKMGVYAYVSILQTLLKLAIVYLLVFLEYDKLIVYGFLSFIVTSIITIIYRQYCIRKFEECSFRYYWDNDLFKELIGYSGWNLFGALAKIINDQGINLLLNVFFGPIVNAARAIAYQLSARINQFVTNFLTAVNPQITKYYASGDHKKMNTLIFQSSKLSYFLLFILSYLFIFETQFILNIWLKEVPEYVVLFIRLIIFNALIESLAYPLRTAAQATGKIKKYQFIVGSIMLLNLPISYLFYFNGAPPETTMIVNLVITIVSHPVRVILLSQMITFPIKDYIFKIIGPIISVSIIVYIFLYLVHLKIEPSINRVIITSILGLFLSSILTIYVGLNNRERQKLFEFVSKKIFKNNRKTSKT